MKLRHAAAVLVGSMTLIHGVAMAAELRISQFKPSSPWELSPATDSYVLSRNFKSETASMFLRMRSYAPGYQFDFTFSGPQISEIVPANVRSITFGSGTPAQFGLLASGTLAEHGPAMVFNSVMSHQRRAFDDKTMPAYPDPELESDVDRFAIDAANRRFVFDTGAIAPVMNALRQCTDELVASWGLDPAVQAKLSRPAQLLNADAVHALALTHKCLLGVSRFELPRRDRRVASFLSI